MAWGDKTPPHKLQGSQYCLYPLEGVSPLWDLSKQKEKPFLDCQRGDVANTYTSVLISTGGPKWEWQNTTSFQRISAASPAACMNLLNFEPVQLFVFGIFQEQAGVYDVVISDF